RNSMGEIDLIMRNPEKNIVFIEVKMARSYRAGDPGWWVDLRKQRQLGRMASAFLQDNNFWNHSCQFDVVAIQVIHGEIHIKHYANAFILY
ncbi:MAG: YraN family protein, partial [bacterium]